MAGSASIPWIFRNSPATHLSATSTDSCMASYAAKIPTRSTIAQCITWTASPFTTLPRAGTKPKRCAAPSGLKGTGTASEQLREPYRDDSTAKIRRALSGVDRHAASHAAGSSSQRVPHLARVPQPRHFRLPRAHAHQARAASMSAPMQIDPCPFCGSKNVELARRTAYFVECFDCFAEGPWKRRHHSGTDHGEKETQIAAVTAWNNRAALS